MTIHSAQVPRRNPDPEQGPQRSNWFAKLVLVPTVPMLLASIAALALFYIAPAQFGHLLERLPGESFLRTALVFAPATLFAVVVLAFLYAVEKPERERVETEAEGKPSSPSRLRMTAWIAMVPVIPGLLLSSALWALSFVSPSRMERLIEPLPGTIYIRRLIPYMPTVLFVAAFILLAYLFLSAPRGKQVVARRKPGLQRFTNASVIITLGFSVLAFGMAMMALVTYHFKPQLFTSLIEHIPFDEIVRAVMMFSPAVLLSLFLLSILFLIKTRKSALDVPEFVEPIAAGVQLREKAATLVMVAGLSFSAVAAIGVLGTLVYLILR